MPAFKKQVIPPTPNPCYNGALNYSQHQGKFMVNSRKRHYGLVGIVLLTALLLGIALPSPPVSAQNDLSDLLSISVRAGYDGRFRPNQWMPLRISVENHGSPITGRIAIRPETTGNALPNMFSAPVDLPTDTVQTFFLYIVARSNADTLKLELLDDTDHVLASRDVRVRALMPRDNLYAVVTGAANSRINLSGLHVGAYEAYQANWLIEDIPDRAAALEAINAIIISDIDTGILTPAQQNALKMWLLNGGHLIITGGSNWESTAAGVEDLLPLIPNGSQTATDMNALVRFAGDYTTEFDDEFILADGTLIDDAIVLAANDDAPLVARRSLGNGTVDYLAIDPGSGQIRTWDSLPELWRMLLTSTNVRPTWSFGFADWERATTASEILPGVNLLPGALSLLGFLLAYILLIGPLNYIVLSRLNHQEWAWATIPIFIIIFTVLAWTLGFELRGDEVTLSRVSVVQTWPESEEAQLNQVIGLLSPRRDDYNIAMPDDRLLRPISDDVAGIYGPSSRSLSHIEIQLQSSDRFAAVDFPVDASFITAFATDGTTAKPDIDGQITISYNVAGEISTIQGSVSNNTEFTLYDPVILAQNTILPLEEALEPNDIVTFSLEDFIATAPSLGALPSPLEYAVATDNPFLSTTASGYRATRTAHLSDSSRSVRDILGETDYQEADFGLSVSDDDETKELRRRQAFLSSFMIDQFSSSARGNRVYLAGWTNDAPSSEDGVGDYKAVDTTLYLIALDVTVDRTQSGLVRLNANQFSWVTLERIGIHDVGPLSTVLYDETELIFQFTPLPDAVLDEVTSLGVTIDRVRTVRSDGLFDVWNWRTEDWEEFAIGRELLIDIPDPARFIGPQNAVRIRLLENKLGYSLSIKQLSIEQLGRFE
jgi:hypothetical protein